MTPTERKAYRPITVKKNIIGLIRGIRGTRNQLKNWELDPSALESQITHYENQLNQFLAERRLNKWTN